MMKYTITELIEMKAQLKRGWEEFRLPYRRTDLSEEDTAYVMKMWHKIEEAEGILNKEIEKRMWELILKIKNDSN